MAFGRGDHCNEDDRNKDHCNEWGPLLDEWGSLLDAGVLDVAVDGSLVLVGNGTANGPSDAPALRCADTNRAARARSRATGLRSASNAKVSSV